MFAGKSTELIRLIGRERRGMSASLGAVAAAAGVLVLTPDTDTRYDETARSVASHDGASTAAWPVPTTEPLGEAVDRLYGAQYAAASVVALDEAQLVQGLVDFCERAAREGKRVLIAGLELTSARTPFGEMAAAAALAETSVKLSAICAFCGGAAAYTLRAASAPAGEVLIGGAAQYRAACRLCHATKSF